jgi:hypothetical protein
VPLALDRYVQMNVREKENFHRRGQERNTEEERD